jgi:hypothetical protein
MSILKSLNIVPEEQGNADPVQVAKGRLIENLETQLKCAEAMVAGEIYMTSHMEMVEDENGNKTRQPVKRPMANTI